MYRERRGLYRVLVGKPDVNKPIGRPMRRGKDNIKTDLQKKERGHELD